MTTATITELTVISSEDLSRATGGKTTVDSHGNLVFDTAGADAYKRYLDNVYSATGTDVNRVSRSVARRVGNTKTFTVEGPRIDKQGTRLTAGLNTGFALPF